MSATERVAVGDDRAGGRLDKLLAALPSVGSRRRAREALRSGKVSVDGEPVGDEEAGRLIGAGSVVEIAWARPGTGKARVAGREAMSRVGVAVIHEDDAVIAVDKPVGLLTDAASREQARHRDTLRKRVRAALGGAMAVPVHRIDRDTTGVVLFAKTKAAHEHLKAQWGRRTPVRVYLALVHGRVRPDAGHWADWMTWDARGRVQRRTKAGADGAVLAEADYTVVERFGDAATLIEVRLVTGRRNQIRLHAQIAGHPLVGESLYGGRPDRRSRRDAPVRLARQALHARRLEVLHPDTGEPLVLEAPVPPDLERALRRLRG